VGKRSRHWRFGGVTCGVGGGGIGDLVWELWEVGGGGIVDLVGVLGCLVVEEVEIEWGNLGK
jgi:hypothetical protein